MAPVRQPGKAGLRGPLGGPKRPALLDGPTRPALLDGPLLLPVQVSAGEFAVVVQVGGRRPEHVAGELVEALLLAVAAGIRRALLAVIDELRILVLVGDEASEVTVVAPIRLQRLVGRRLRTRVLLRPPLFIRWTIMWPDPV